MILNKKKSAVVEFLPRASSNLIKSKEIQGIPIEPKYKYLGLWLNQKLTLDDQIAHIKKKSDFIKNSISPVLSSRSLDYRKNLWDLFIRPLFEFTLPVDFVETAKTRKNNLRKTLKYTFKCFTKLSKTTPDSLIFELCGYDIDKRGKDIYELQTAKWESRLQNWRDPNFINNIQQDRINNELEAFRELTDEEAKLEIEGLEAEEAKEEAPINRCKWIPAVGIEYINLLTKLCSKCSYKVIMDTNHLRTVHDLHLPDPLELFQEVQKRIRQPGTTRIEKLSQAYTRIKEKVDMVYHFLA